MSLYLPILVTLLLAVLSPWWVARHRASFIAAGVLLQLWMAVYFVRLLADSAAGADVVRSIAPNLFPTDLIEWSFAGTPWSLLFAVMITGIGLLIFLYAQGYFGNSSKGHRFHASLLTFEAAMLGVVLADHAVLLFLFWELTSVSSFFLIGYNHQQKEARWNALQALLVTGIGGVSMLAGFLILGNEWGSFSFETWRAMAHEGTPVPLVALSLILLGAITKSALFPFFFWLPNAMSAPAPVSSYLHSATMVKAGIFLIGALHPLFESSRIIMMTLVVLGGLTSVSGLLLGWIQTDTKKILAYTTLSVLGMLALLMGLGSPEALKVAVLVMVGHACYKAGLFMVAGAVDKATGCRDVRRLGGLRHVLPLLGVASLVLALSKAGFPPLLGFVGKEYAYKLGFAGPGASYALLVFLFMINTGLMALALRVAWTPFRKMRPADGPDPAATKPLSPMMLAGPVILAVAGILLGILAPWLLSPVVSAVVSQIHGRDVTFSLKLWHGFQPALFLSLITLASGWWIFRSTTASGLQNSCTRWLGGFEAAYGACYSGLMNGAAWLSGKLQSGDLRAYLRCFFSGVLILVGYKWWSSGFALVSLPEDDGPIPWVEWMLLPVIAVFLWLVVSTYSRILALLALAVIGLAIAFLFARLGAPDLALTLLLVETFTIVLFIHMIRGLPPIRTIVPLRGRLADIAIACGVGVMMTLLVLKAQVVQTHPAISNTLVEWSYALAKGKNVVNVILVDFRALDTLGEITVIALAAVGVHMLWKKAKPATPKP
jgi:multicomponent Na+:H+ antiporter subunit A